MPEVSLKHKTISGVVWSAVERFSSLSIQMLCTLVIARFLTPADFGTVGMLTIFTAIAQTLVDSGFRTALIRKNDATEVDYSSVFFFNFAFSVLLYVLLFFLSPLIAAFYKMPILEGVSKCTFLVIPINAIGLIQGTILTKNLHFKTLAKATVLSAIISGIVGVFLAFKCRSLWAIVVQNVLHYLLQTVFLWLFARWRPRWVFSFSAIKGLFAFSFNMMLSGLVGTIFNNIYGLLIGKFYSASDLGNYTQAQKLQSLPSSSLTEVIQRVSYPVLSKFQNDNELLKRQYRRVIGVAFLIVSYMMFWLMGVSTQLFDVLFNDQWVDAGRFFSILCLNGVFYPLHSINVNILSIKGRSDIYLYLEVARRCICIAIIVVTSFYSIDVFVWGMVGYSLIVLILNLTVCGKFIDYRFLDQVRDLLPTFIVGLLTMLVIKYAFAPLHLRPIVSLFLQTLTALVFLWGLTKLTKNAAMAELESIVSYYFNLWIKKS